MTNHWRLLIAYLWWSVEPGSIALKCLLHLDIYNFCQPLFTSWKDGLLGTWKYPDFLLPCFLPASVESSCHAFESSCHAFESSCHAFESSCHAFESSCHAFESLAMLLNLFVMLLNLFAMLLNLFVMLFATLEKVQCLEWNLFARVTNPFIFSTRCKYILPILNKIFKIFGTCYEVQTGLVILSHATNRISTCSWYLFWLHKWDWKIFYSGLECVFRDGIHEWLECVVNMRSYCFECVVNMRTYCFECVVNMKTYCFECVVNMRTYCFECVVNMRSYCFECVVNMRSFCFECVFE